MYRFAGGPSRIGLYNHKQGHSVPAEAERRIDEWFQPARWRDYSEAVRKRSTRPRAIGGRRPRRGGLGSL